MAIILETKRDTTQKACSALINADIRLGVIISFKSQDSQIVPNGQPK